MAILQVILHRSYEAGTLVKLAAMQLLLLSAAWASFWIQSAPAGQVR